MPRHVCCVPGCSIVASDGVPLHYFPNPETFAEKFQVWVKNIGVDIASLDSSTFFKTRRICRRHFETQFLYPKNRLSKLAMPTLLLPSGDISAPISPLVPDSQPSTSQEDSLLNPDIQHSTTENAVEYILGSGCSIDRPRPTQKRKRQDGALHEVLPATNILPCTSKPQPGPSGPRPAKRERRDDTTSPSTLWGEAERDHSAQGEQRTYVRATKDIPAWLAVAICFPAPSRDMSKEEAEHVKTDLERLLMKTDSTTPLPAFRGYPRLAEGTVQMWCEDDNALTWLAQNVPRIRLPDTDLTLTVLRQSDVPTHVRASLFVPRYKGDVAQLQSILIRQNTWYDIARWSLYRATTVGGDNYGTYLALGVPREEVEKVMGRERRISYLLGSIYVRFWPTTQPSDAKTTQPTPTQTNDMDIAQLEAFVAPVVTDNDTKPPALPHDNQYRVEEVERLSDGSISN